MDAPTGDVRTWTHSAVHAWLASLGLASYAPKFVEHDITGAVLPDVTRPMLRTIGVERVGDQLRLAAAIDKLRIPSFPSTTTSLPPLQSPLNTLNTLPLQPATPATPEAGWDDTIEVLDPDLNWAPESDPRPRPRAATRSRARAPSIPSTSSPDYLFDPLGNRRPSTPNSVPGSLALATPLEGLPPISDPKTGSRYSPMLTRTPTGMSAHRLGSRPPPLHLAQSSTSALPAATRHAGLTPARTLPRGNAHLHSESLGSAGSQSSMLRMATNSGNPPPSWSPSSPAFPNASNVRHANTSIGMASTGISSPNSVTVLHPSTSQHLPPPHVTYHPSPPAQPATSPTHSHSTQPSGSGLYPLPPNTAPSLTPSTSAAAVLPYDLPHTPTSAPNVAPGVYESPEQPGSASGRATPLLARTGSGMGSSNFLRGFGSGSGNASTPTSTSTPTLEDLQRRTMKFVSADGASRMVTVSDCYDASAVMARVLRKFGVPATGNGYALGSPVRSGSQSAGPGGEVWRVAARMPEGQTRLLEADELLAICQGAPVHDRAMGLLLVCLNPSPGSAPLLGKAPVAVAPAPSDSLDLARSTSASGINGLDRSSVPKDRTGSMGSDAGRSPAASLSALHNLANQYTSSSQYGHSTEESQRWAEQDGQEDMDSNTSNSSLLEPPLRVELSAPSGSRRPRGMSKLEAFFGVRSDTLEALGTSNSGVKLDSKAEWGSLPLQRTRKFVGQRPSSELISSHLADYFPATEKRVLQRSARRSMYRASMHQDRVLTPQGEREEEPSTLPPVPPSGEGWRRNLLASGHSQAPHARASPSLPSTSQQLPPNQQLHRPSWAPHAASPNNNAPLPPPPADKPDKLSPMLCTRNVAPAPPPKPPGWQPTPQPRLRPSGESMRPLSRRTSTMSSHSDAASLITVDEITMEVESRRELGLDTEFDPAPPRRSTDEGRKSLRSVGSSRSLRSRRSRPKSLAHSMRRTSTTVSDPKEDQRTSTSARPPSQERGTISVDGTQTLSSFTSKADGVSTPTGAGQQSTEADTSSLTDDGLEMYEEEFEFESDQSSDLSDETGREQVGGRSQIRWIKGALIGAGSFGNVFLGMNQRTGIIMAVKQVELPPRYTSLDEGESADLAADKGPHARRIGQLHALEREIELLKSLKHPNIVQYLDSYADATHLNIFLEYVPGGSVAALVSNYGQLNEHLARKFTRQILDGLKFLHSKAIVHRDIKGANILVDTASTVKISDFGISKKVESVVAGGPHGGNKKHRASLQGSVFWMAPEVVKQTSYTSKADIWSLGCLVVEMLTGTHPWASLNQMQALFKIGSGAAHPAIPDSISSLAKDFLEQTFEFDHQARPDAATLLEHPWLNSSAQKAAATPSTPTTATASSSLLNAPSAPSPHLTSAEPGPRIVRKKRPSPAFGQHTPAPSG